MKPHKVALVHDWLIHMRGGEKVLEAIAEVFPDAEIYTLFCDRSRLSPPLQKMKIRTSFLQRLPGIQKFYRWLLPFLPPIIKTLRIKEADLVISSSHCVAKGARVPQGIHHLCYCHTPMRYAWGFGKEYFSGFPSLIKPFLNLILSGLRRWDLRSNGNVSGFIANSQNVGQRILQFYNRDSQVIYPPVDTKFYSISENPSAKKDYYLIVSAFVPYKRVDLAIEAFNDLDRKLFVVGAGPLEEAYRKLRKSTQITFFTSLSGEKLRELYQGARAVVFPTEEDFGIVPVEAQACGTPVIAFGKGGALEGVRSGVFFYDQTPEALRRAVLDFEKKSFDPRQVRERVLDFDREIFKSKMGEAVKKVFEVKEELVGAT